MALSIDLTSGATQYRLLADEVRVSVGRAPLAVKLPANINPILIDLGQKSVTINVSGISEEVSGTDAGITVPTKIQLENFAEDLYNQTITLTINSRSTAHAYIGKIVSVDFTMINAREDRWEFRLQLVAQSRT